MYHHTLQHLPSPKTCLLQTRQAFATLVTTAQVVLMLRHKIWQHQATMWLLLVKAYKLNVLLEHTIHSTPKPHVHLALLATTAQVFK